MASSADNERRFGDLDVAERVGRFNRLKEHITFGALRAQEELPPPHGVVYFTPDDLKRLEVDLSGRRILLARGPCLSPQEDPDDYLSMAPLAPILLGNMLRTHGASVEIRDLLRDRDLCRATASLRGEVIPRGEWKRALDGHPSPRVTRILEASLRGLRAEGFDAVGLSVETGGDFPLSLYLTRELRARQGIPTILGGRAMVLPEPLLQQCPEAILVHDEGEVPLLLCLEALFSGGRLEDVPSLIWTEGGELRSTHAMIHDLDIRPTYDLTDAHLEGYRARLEVEGTGPLVPYQYAIGCPHMCGFCNATSRRIMRLRSPEKIVADLEHVVRRYGVQRFHMLSHLLNADRDHMLELISRLEAADLGIYWSDCCKPAGMDAESLRRLRGVGASVLVWGVDCGSDRLSRLMRKGVRQEQALQIFEASHRAGIYNIVNIIVGMPHETEEDRRETVAFMHRIKPFVREFQTPVYRHDRASLLATNPERYGLAPGADGGVDEPRGLRWTERVARIKADQRWVRRKGPILIGLDLRGRLERLRTGPYGSALRSWWQTKP